MPEDFDELLRFLASYSWEGIYDCKDYHCAETVNTLRLKLAGLMENAHGGTEVVPPCVHALTSWPLSKLGFDEPRPDYPEQKA